ncbi:MAG: WD40 repeat domain-containing protein [Deltaproteobacteria bacterium]|nr:WD40 repeat domain-containing protein [Deltaproteobacteria bacterium]
MTEEHLSLQGHQGHVSAIRFTADGKLMLTAGMDNLIKLWSVEDDFAEARSLEAHDKPLNDIALSPDQTLLVSVGADRLVKLWSFPDLEPIETLQGHKNTIAAVQFSPDGKLFATASFDTTVRVWDRETGECVHTLKGHKRNVTSLAWLSMPGSPAGPAGVKAGTVLASAGLGDDIVLWRLPSGEREELVTGHKAAVTLGGVTPDGQRLISAGYEGQVKLWSVGTWAPKGNFEPGVAGLLCLALAPHGTMLAIGSEKSVALWSLETFEELTELPIKPKGLFAVAFSPDTEWLVASGSDKKLRVWSVDSII